jgi:hypothetical protein
LHQLLHALLVFLRIAIELVAVADLVQRALLQRLYGKIEANGVNT